MPSRNVIKLDVADAYYHVYARGASKQPIFLEHTDYAYFLSLLERYLSKNQKISKTGVLYPHFHELLHLLSFCLMGNHFHLLIYQKDQGVMTRFMKSLMTSYGRYFNLKYKRSGSLYESTYKASRVDSNNYLEHISRYIHLNPRYWRNYQYSSVGYYINAPPPEWLSTQPILELFAGTNEYKEFLADYQEHKEMLDEVKRQLANQ